MSYGSIEREVKIYFRVDSLCLIAIVERHQDNRRTNKWPIANRCKQPGLLSYALPGSPCHRPLLIIPLIIIQCLRLTKRSHLSSVQPQLRYVYGVNSVEFFGFTLVGCYLSFLLIRFRYSHPIYTQFAWHSFNKLKWNCLF